jgi:hypothetical protein
MCQRCYALEVCRPGFTTQIQYLSLPGSSGKRFQNTYIQDHFWDRYLLVPMKHSGSIQRSGANVSDGPPHSGCSWGKITEPAKPTLTLLLRTSGFGPLGATSGSKDNYWPCHLLGSTSGLATASGLPSAGLPNKIDLWVHLWASSGLDSHRAASATSPTSRPHHTPGQGNPPRDWTVAEDLPCACHRP